MREGEYGKESILEVRVGSVEEFDRWDFFLRPYYNCRSRYLYQHELKKELAIKVVY
jgi:hypothetical protein